MKRILITMAATPILIMGCNTTFDGQTYTDAQGTDAEVVAAALLGGSDTLTEETIGAAGATGVIEASMNGKIAQTISTKVEEQINEMLESGELNVDELESASMQGKDVNVGFNWRRGFFVNVADEHVPFAGGEMILNGGVDLTMRYLGGGRFALVTSGELNAELDGVEKEGSVRNIPYALSLDGSNTLGVDGSFAVTIKRFKVRNMSADLTAAVIGSNVTATGEVADRTVTAAVDMMNLSLKIGNDDILGNPKGFGVSCAGDIAIKMNDDVFASCTIASSCDACE